MTLTCRKRHGASVPFDSSKIRRALFLCFNAVGSATRLSGGGAEEERIVAELTQGVVNSLKAQRLTDPDVEHIQRLVIQQLWAHGLFEEAEHYQNYRESHRKNRQTRSVDPKVASRIAADQHHFPSDLQYYQFVSKFARWREADKRRETWKECVYERVCPWLFKIPGVSLTEQEEDQLARGMYDLEVSPAMRVVQMAGPALDRCNVGAYNCSYHPLSDIFAFSELLYILMQGTGSGFSVESDYVSELPRVKKQNGKKETIVCEDTTESWCSTFDRHLNLLWDGWDTFVDVTKVRPKNARLRTKGGRSSGPAPFLELISFSRHLLKARQGRFLEDIDAHDLACVSGKIVQVGGVRRAAEISLSDLNSRAMRDAKSGNWYASNVHRTMANNSFVLEDVPPVEVFMEEWLALVKSKSGERGMFSRYAVNLHKPKRRKPWKFGCNPCAEINLRPYEFCNLSIVVAKPWDTEETLTRKVRLSTYFGKMQSLATSFRYLRPDWKKNCEEERLLGVDITGHADCPLLRFGASGRYALLGRLAEEVRRVDRMLSARWGVNESAASTCVKPGGDSSVLFNCGSGLSPWFSQFSMRWVREPKDTPVAKYLRAAGVPCAEAPEAPGELFVFGFPRAAPEGVTVRDDMTALDQLENWLVWKKHWAEHSASATIYVEEREWPRVGAWVYDHIDEITGLSFLPKDNGIYTYAPNEALTRDKYDQILSGFPSLNWSKLVEYEDDDETAARQTFACTGPGCD